MAEPMMSDTRITVAVGINDRTLPLLAGLASIAEVEATFETAPLEEIFARAFDEQAYDVTELSFSNYLYMTALGDCPYLGLPIFPSRSFRHSAIYVRRDRGIEEPKDLKGCTVGVREYSMTAALVARGVLEDEYGVRAQDIKWRFGRIDPKDTQPITRMLPCGVELEPVGPDELLSDMLGDGQLDALVAYKPPPVFLEGHPKVRRLFADYASAEQDYARRTGIFPIMHLIGVHRNLIRDDPGLALRICAGFEAARQYSFDRLGENQALYAMLPWGALETERTKAALGENYWTYGLPANRTALEALCRYSFAQGISPKLMQPEDLFVPETVDWRP